MREFNNPIDVAVGLIPVMRSTQIELAGIIRGKAADDGFGKAGLVGGFVNEGESIEVAIAREAEEEIGFKSSSQTWRLLYSRHVPGRNLNLVFCLYRNLIQADILATASPSDEVKGLLYITQATKLAFALHEEAVRLYYSRYQHEQQILARYR
jgi:ADP-ribose pyrophosphatase YjhB (NUDIX family)